MKKYFRKAVVIVFWLLLWQIAATAVRNQIIFVGPLDAGRALFAQLPAAEFWRSVGNSFLKITAGFLTGFFAGMILAAAACRYQWLYELLEPFMGFVQSVPVASFVILALIWFGSKGLPLLISFLVVCPIIYRNVTAGIRQTDRKLLEMAGIFRMSWWKRLWYLYRPAVLPDLTAGCRVALGMSWKSGVAAEVIGVTGHSIGEKLYLAKIYLSTADLFAWSFVIVVLSRLFEGGFLYLMNVINRDLDVEKHSSAFRARFFRRWSNGVSDEEKPKEPSVKAQDIRMEHVSKSFGEQKVLTDVSLGLEKGKIYCLMGESGVGKTTLLRLLMGLEQPDTGSIIGIKNQRISAVFQEERLISFLDGAENVRIMEEKRRISEAETLLGQLLMTEEIHCMAAHMSGGMKRRVEIARALASPSDILLMDEPFSGLDGNARETAIAVIKKYQRGRTILLVTHQKEDAVKLGAEIIWLKES